MKSLPRVIFAPMRTRCTIPFAAKLVMRYSRRLSCSLSLTNVSEEDKPEQNKPVEIACHTGYTEMLSSP